VEVLGRKRIFRSTVYSSFLGFLMIKTFILNLQLREKESFNHIFGTYRRMKTPLFGQNNFLIIVGYIYAYSFGYLIN
jgi:hypothetical protein